MRKFGFAAMVCSFAVIMCSCNLAKEQKAENVATTQAVNMGEVTVATINTDTLFAEYQMVKDVTNELERTEKKLQTDLQNQAKFFQTEYENYLRVGATMTLNEQKKKEEYLTSKKESLDQMSTRYADQMMQLRLQRMQEVQDKVFSFIEEYNKNNGNYTFIVSNARTSGVLCSPKNIDITESVLEAMNAEYKKNKE